MQKEGCAKLCESYLLEILGKNAKSLELDADVNFISSVWGRAAIKEKNVNSAKHARITCALVNK